MPIIENPAPDAPLSQGDILKDVNLFATGEGWHPTNGEPKKTTHRLCLVLTRPCGIVHKEAVIVAGVEKLQDDVPREMAEFGKVLSFLNTLRDGLTSPDIFYLGQLPRLTGRYGARFDALHTIQIPLVGEERKAFVKAKRLGVLHVDFVRDLHARLFRAVASLGFDDHSWLSDPDLKWLVECGKAELAHLQAEVQKHRSQQSSQEARGGRFEAKDLLKAEQHAQELADRISPYETEYRRRTAPMPMDSGNQGAAG
jgi:hypothetical protein